MNLKFWNRTKEPVDLWLVGLQGTECRIRGKAMTGFFAERIVHAPSEYEARVASIQNLRDELQALDDRLGVPPSIFVTSIRELSSREKGPRRQEIHFFEKEDQTPFFDALAEKLSDFPGTVVREDDLLTANPTDGFAVTVEWDGEFTVTALRWHCHFDHAGEAKSCFGWLLTPYHRVVSEEREGDFVGAWVERYTVSGWIPMSPVFAGTGGLQPEDPAQYRLTIAQHAVLDIGDYKLVEPGVQLDEDDLPPGSHLGTKTEERSHCTARELGILPPVHDFGLE